MTTLIRAPSAPAITQPKNVVRSTGDVRPAEQEPNRDGERAERKHPHQHPAQIDDLRLARGRLLVARIDQVELAVESPDLVRLERLRDDAVHGRSGDHHVPVPDEEPVHEQPLAEPAEGLLDGDGLHLRAVEQVRHLRMGADEVLGVGVDLVAFLAEEEELLEAARWLRGEHDRHRADLADVAVHDLAVRRLEGAALLAVTPLRVGAVFAARPRLDEVGERDPRLRLRGRQRLVGGGDGLLVRMRDSGHLEIPPSSRPHGSLLCLLRVGDRAGSYKGGSRTLSWNTSGRL